jgi:hypothetical protein
MTVLLEKAFEKVTSELNEKEQDLFANFLLQEDIHDFLDKTIRLITEYNSETQQAIHDVDIRNNTQTYDSFEQLRHKLGL